MIWQFLNKNPLLAVILILSCGAVISAPFIYVSHLKSSIKTLTSERDGARALATEYSDALKAQQLASAAKVAALEEAAANVQERAKNLQDQLNRIATSDEKITCPVPFMVRSVIDGLR